MGQTVSGLSLPVLPIECSKRGRPWLGNMEGFQQDRTIDLQKKKDTAARVQKPRKGEQQHILHIYV